MFLYNANGYTNIDKNPDNSNANINANIEIITPITANNNFIIIKNFNPSKSAVKIIPGNLTLHPAISQNRSNTKLLSNRKHETIVNIAKPNAAPIPK